MSRRPHLAIVIGREHSGRPFFFRVERWIDGCRTHLATGFRQTSKKAWIAAFRAAERI